MSLLSALELLYILAFDVLASLGWLGKKGQKLQRSIAAFLDNERGRGWCVRFDALHFCDKQQRLTTVFTTMMDKSITENDTHTAWRIWSLQLILGFQNWRRNYVEKKKDDKEA